MPEPQVTNIRKLVINKCTEEQYNAMVKNADELYLTPDTGGGGGGGSGTVTSVRVQAGTGLTSSQSTAQTQVLNTTISVASGYKLPTTTEWNNKQNALPSQSGQSGKYLTTNGSTMSWATVQGGDSLPDQTGQAGKFLTTDGSSASWGEYEGSFVPLSDLEEAAIVAKTGDYNDLINKPVDSFPSQTGQAGKFLTTDGTTLIWVPIAGQKYLTFTNLSASTWLPDSTYTNFNYKCILTCNGVTSTDYAQVIFYPEQASSGNYANVCLTDTDSVTIYSKINTSITIPTIIVTGVQQ